MVFRLQIGGESRGGKLLEEVIKLRIEMEDEIPLVSPPQSERIVVASANRDLARQRTSQGRARRHLLRLLLP